MLVALERFNGILICGCGCCAVRTANRDPKPIRSHPIRSGPGRGHNSREEHLTSARDVQDVRTMGYLLLRFWLDKELPIVWI